MFTKISKPICKNQKYMPLSAVLNEEILAILKKYFDPRDYQVNAKFKKPNSLRKVTKCTTQKHNLRNRGHPLLLFI